jgi:predicted metal-dependent hydrolase
LVSLPEPPLLPQDPEEQALVGDPRLARAIALFNGGDWYACHDCFEELWHETSGRMRPLLQGILQIAVAELHHERGNLRGATILMGEGLGRLQGNLEGGLDLDLDSLRRQVGVRLQALQQQRTLRGLDLPYLAVKNQA